MADFTFEVPVPCHFGKRHHVRVVVRNNRIVSVKSTCDNNNLAHASYQMSLEKPAVVRGCVTCYDAKQEILDYVSGRQDTETRVGREEGEFTIKDFLPSTLMGSLINTAHSRRSERKASSYSTRNQQYQVDLAVSSGKKNLLWNNDSKTVPLNNYMVHLMREYTGVPLILLNGQPLYDELAFHSNRQANIDTKGSSKELGSNTAFHNSIVARYSHTDNAFHCVNAQNENHCTIYKKGTYYCPFCMKGFSRIGKHLDNESHTKKMEIFILKVNQVFRDPLTVVRMIREPKFKRVKTAKFLEEIGKGTTLSVLSELLSTTPILFRAFPKYQQNVLIHLLKDSTNFVYYRPPNQFKTEIGIVTPKAQPDGRIYGNL